MCPAPSCTCKEFTKRDVSCSKPSELHHGKKACYVKHPSSCNDLIDSHFDAGEQMSAEACSIEGNSNLSIVQSVCDLLIFHFKMFT